MRRIVTLLLLCCLCSFVFAKGSSGHRSSHSSKSSKPPKAKKAKVSKAEKTVHVNGEGVLKSNTSTGAAVKRYWSMGGNTLAEGDGSGNLTAEYVYFGGQRIARIDLPANAVHTKFATQ